MCGCAWQKKSYVLYALICAMATTAMKSLVQSLQMHDLILHGIHVCHIAQYRLEEKWMS